MPERCDVALAVDALTPRLTGIGRYAWELAQGLPKEPRVARVSFFRGKEWLDDPTVLLDPEPHRPKMLGRAGNLLRRFARCMRPPGIVHAPNYFLPPWVEPGTGIATIHDLSVFRFPETHPAERIATFERHFADTIQRAAILLVDTEWNRRELIAFAGLALDKVHAVPLGVGAAYRPRPDAELAAPLERLGLTPGGYGLCVSTLEPRKRIGCLLAAWRLLPFGLRARFPLVLAGAAGWRNGELLAQIDQARHEGWLIFPGFVDEAELPMLYAGARMFAYPSRYEGFGLPPLEAMASGVPTLVAPGTCVTEITEGGARVADVEDIEQFSREIQVLLEDEGSRAAASSAGSKVAAAYSWDHCLTGTVDAYLRIS